MCFQNKIVLVTGASSGIGEAICRRFLQEKSVVIGMALEEESKICDENFYYFKADLSKEEAVQTIVEFATSRFHKIDILINCAGITQVGDLESISYDEFNRQIKVNLYSVFNTCKGCIKELKKSSGIILNVGSDLGVRPIKERIAYSTSKAAVIMFTKCLALELAPQVRVNGINPGLVETPMISGRFKEAENPDELRNIYANLYPLKRMGTLEDMIEAVLFLTGEKSGFITGEFLNVSGGSLI